MEFMETRVRILITTRLGRGFKSRLDMVAMDSEPVEDFRSEIEIATALRNLANRIEKGTGFVGIKTVNLNALGDQAWGEETL